MVDAVSERHHSRAWQAPAKTARHNTVECLHIEIFEVFLFLRVTDPWQHVVILVITEDLVEEIPFDLKLIQVGDDMLLKNLVLELIQLGERPVHGQVSEIDNLKEGVPERLFAFDHLCHDEEDESQILRVYVSLEEIWMLIVYLAYFRVVHACISLIDHDLLGDIKECCHRRYITSGKHAH